MRAMEYGCKCYHLAGRTAELVDAGCALHGPYRTRVNTTKHLTDTECAAEYWRAKADLATIEAVLVSPAAMNARVRVWHRFATHPHASEVEA